MSNVKCQMSNVKCLSNILKTAGISALFPWLQMIDRVDEVTTSMNANKDGEHDH